MLDDQKLGAPKFSWILSSQFGRAIPARGDKPRINLVWPPVLRVSAGLSAAPSLCQV